MPPLDKGGTRPQPIDLLERSAATLHTMWMTKTMHTEFLRKAKHWRSAARSGAKRLDKALARAKEPLDAADRRYAADAELLRHLLLVLSFELSEAIAVAETVPDDAWQDDETYPGIRPTPWIQPGNDPEAIETTDAEIQDPQLGERVKTARAAHLRRFGGTPFGLQVAANGVETWVLTKGRKIEPTGKPMPVGRTPGESEGTPAPPSPRPPGGGSSGGGPSTGGG